MKKLLNWQLALGLSLLTLSAFIYWVHFLIFRDAHHIFIYLLGDIAFIPVEVLLVTIIIHQLLERREKNERMEKLNMVIGVFFSEVGTELMSRFAAMDKRIDDIRDELRFSNDRPLSEFDKAASYLRSHSYEVIMDADKAQELGKFLSTKRDFLLRLLENPNLLEHESFTKLLRSVFHLTEELSSRHGFHGLPAKDFEHLAGDVRRAYMIIIGEWLNYMKHLKSQYPYLFSLALRTNPFDESASVIIN